MNIIQKVLAKIVYVTKLLNICYFRFSKKSLLRSRYEGRHVTLLPHITAAKQTNLKNRKSLEPSGFFRFLLYKRRKLQFTCKSQCFTFMRVIYSIFPRINDLETK